MNSNKKLGFIMNKDNKYGVNKLIIRIVEIQDDYRIRNISDMYNDYKHYLSDLCIKAYYTENIDDSVEISDYSLVYENFESDCKTVKKMYDTFKFINKKLDNLNKKYGDCTDINQFILRLADILKIKLVVSYDKKSLYGDYDASTFNFHEMLDFKYIVKSELKKTAYQNRS